MSDFFELAGHCTMLKLKGNGNVCQHHTMAFLVGSREERGVIYYLVVVC